MKKLFLLGAACVAIVAPSGMHAFFDTFLPVGYYAGVQGGANFAEFNRHSGGGNHNRNNTGYYVGGTVGFRTCSNFRFEGEVGYRNNQSRNRRGGGGVSGSFSNSVSGGGSNSRRHLSSTSFMFNGLYDIDLCFPVKPYVGFGIGYAYTQNPRNGSGSNSGNGSVSFSNSGTTNHRRDRNGFAWQAIGGLAYPLDFLSSCGWNSIEGTLEYRYFKPQANHVYHNTVLVGLKTYF